MRFLGNIEAKTDSKGRAFLPAIFRKELQANGEEQLIIRKDVFQPCLVLYPESVWNRQMDLLRKRLNRWDRSQQTIFRQFVAEAEPVTLDANGRLLIPRRYAKTGLGSRPIRFIGMDDTIEIWDADETEATFMQPDAFGKAIEGLMKSEGEGNEA